LPKVFTKTGLPSTAVKVLESIYHETQNEWLRVFLMHRKAGKLKATFLDGIYQKLDRHNVLRIGYNEIGAQGGRVSSYGPNGQNFPKALRGQIIPRPGYKFITWDLSQAEVRILAAFSQDEALLRDCNAGRDLHRVFASRIFAKPEDEIVDNERQTSKTIVFGIIYGLGIENLSKALGCSTQAAEELIELFYNTYPGVREWRKRTLAAAAVAPYQTQTMIGTRRSSLGMQSIDNRTKSKAERVACNQPIQGTGGELTFYYINNQLEVLDNVLEAAWDYKVSSATALRKTEFFTTYRDLIEQVAELPRETLEELFEKRPSEVARLALTVHDSATFEVVDCLAEVFASIAAFSFEVPCPWGRLKDVRIEAEVKIEDHWDGEPDLVKAIDPKFYDGKSKFPWHMIAPEMLEKEDADEMKEVINEDQ
jgi:DNA polymerase-1